MLYLDLDQDIYKVTEVLHNHNKNINEKEAKTTDIEESYNSLIDKFKDVNLHITNNDTLTSAQLPHLHLPNPNKIEIIEYKNEKQNKFVPSTKQSRMEALSKSMMYKSEKVAPKQSSNLKVSNWRNNKFEELMAFSFEVEKQKKNHKIVSLKHKIKFKDISDDSKKKVKFSLPNVND